MRKMTSLLLAALILLGGCTARISPPLGYFEALHRCQSLVKRGFILKEELGGCVVGLTANKNEYMEKP